MSNKLKVWQMIKEAIEQSENKVIQNREIKDYIKNKYGDVNSSTLNCQILICTVNIKSRVNWAVNQKPRVCDDDRYDLLYSVGHGKVEIYNPEVHGQWEICRVDNARLVVKKLDDIADAEDDTDTDSTNEEKRFTFELESQLRDFIAQNITHIDSNLSLYVSDDGVDGVEYQTDVGYVDILAQNKDNEFVVIELKLSKGADVALGQIQRYMGWVKKNLAENNANVHGVIIAKSISEGV